MSTAQEVTAEEVTERLRRAVAELLEMETEELDTDVPLSAFGIDSVTSSVLLGDLEKWYRVRPAEGASLGRLTLAEAAEAVVSEMAREPRGPHPTKER